MGQTQSSELGHENEALGLGLSVIKIITNEIQFAVHTRLPVHASIMATRSGSPGPAKPNLIYRPHTTQNQNKLKGQKGHKSHCH